MVEGVIKGNKREIRSAKVEVAQKKERTVISSRPVENL